MKNMMEVINATKIFGGLKANENITFDVHAGEILGIVGPNGAGKTTLFNSMSGAHKLTSGQIIFDGVDVTKMKAHEICKLGLGRTFQIPQSLNELTVFENVLVGAMCHSADTRKAGAIADQVMEDCGITKFKSLMAGKLNVAQKKRLEIARAMATHPKLLLLDETMAGLTATERRDSLDLIRKINATGTTILLIEHNMDVVMNVSNRVVVLTTGKVLKIGTPAEITSDEDVINAYLGRAKHA